MDRLDKLKTDINLEQSLHETTTIELLYFMAKCLEELTKRSK